MKKMLAVLLAVFLLAGCAGPAEETTHPTETTVPETTLPETEPSTQKSEPSLFADYEYRHTDERDRNWEEDIVYLTKTLLGENVTKGHPYLQDKDFTIYTLRGMDQVVSSGNFYDATLRDEFIAAMDQLIDAIPDLTDTQIVFEMQANLAMLKDLHTSVYQSLEYQGSLIIPVFYEVLWNENGPELYVTQLPEKYEECLLGRLLSVNGVDISTILKDIGAYTPAENEYAAVWAAASWFSTSLISYPEMLAQIGVMELTDSTVELTFELEDGTVTTIQAPVLTIEEAYASVKRVYGDLYRRGAYIYTNYLTDNYWYDVLEEDHLLYIRFNRFDKEEDCTYREFVRQIDEVLRNAEGITKVAVDVRINGGGWGIYADTLIDAIENAGIEQVYVLIDSGSYSASINLATYLRVNMECARIVGTPGGQPANFWGGVQGFYLPNSGLYFQRPSTFCNNIPGDENDALMPDIIIYQTIEDYRNGIDTVLEAVKNFE